MTNKILILTICFFTVFGCSKNQFKKNSDLHVFTFGIAGYDDYKFCKKNIPNFIAKYPSGRNPSRICIHYQYYTCHVNHYCNGDKKCEMEAAQYWTPNWQNANGDIEKRVAISKKVCDSEAAKNNIAK